MVKLGWIFKKVLRKLIPKPKPLEFKSAKGMTTVSAEFFLLLLATTIFVNDTGTKHNTEDPSTKYA